MIPCFRKLQSCIRSQCIQVAAIFQRSSGECGAGIIVSPFLRIHVGVPSGRIPRGASGCRTMMVVSRASLPAGIPVHPLVSLPLKFSNGSVWLPVDLCVAVLISMSYHPLPLHFLHGLHLYDPEPPQRLQIINPPHYIFGIFPVTAGQLGFGINVGLGI